MRKKKELNLPDEKENAQGEMATSPTKARPSQVSIIYIYIKY